MKPKIREISPLEYMCAKISHQTKFIVFSYNRFYNLNLPQPLKFSGERKQVCRRRKGKHFFKNLPS